MKKVLVFAGSNSRQSINKQLAIYAASLLSDVETQVIDLNDYPMSIFDVDIEKEQGMPENALNFHQTLSACDGVVLSLAEHNGSYAAVFKNLFDWISRIEADCWQHKPMLLMATSPGGRGGATVLAAANDRFPRQGGNIVAKFTLPSFGDNFSDGKLIDQALKKELVKAVNMLESEL